MRPVSSAPALSMLLAVVLVSSPTRGTAQLIGLKTVPLAAGDQFYFAPSSNMGMADVSIAHDDPLADPFVNPAKGARIGRSRFFSAPTAYAISNQNGGAQTLPFGMLLVSGSWFGGGVAALQQLDMGGRLRRVDFRVDPISTEILPPWDALADESTTNKYLQAVLGRTFGDGDLAVAASAMAADLNGTDGVEDLFANAWEIEEFGHVQDYRVGLIGSLPGDRTFEAVLVHNRVNLSQDVTTVDWTLTDTLSWTWTPDVERETNGNKSRTWGAHLGYVQPIGDSDWRVGGILTVNRKDHPKIPTYDLTRVIAPLVSPIPRDPGESWAYDIGVGLSQRSGPTTFALDLVYEPAVSNTWADAESDILAADGSTIAAGERTVDNRFVFSNAHLSAGLGQEIGRGTLQVGFRARHYDYRLRQEDHVELTTRSQTEQWTEWTPTWGFRYSLPNVELSYSGSASSASHFPFFDGRRRLLEATVTFDAAGADILAPPTGDLTIPDETTVMHRLAVSIPIR